MNRSTAGADKARRILTEHYLAYPKMQARDVLKLLYQSAFGCEHLVASEDDAAEYISREFEGIPKDAEPLTEPLAGEYSRVHLSQMISGLSPRTLARLFCLSAKKEEQGIEMLENMLSAARELIESGAIPISLSDLDREAKELKAMGYPPVRHSQAFRDEYSPAYRVIANRYVLYLPLLARIDSMLKSGDCILAVEGGSASGKSTLSDILSEIYDCAVVHMDDFFLRPEQRTKERFNEVGGNIDKERFLCEVVEPLRKGEAVCYRPFDCSAMTLGEPISLPKKSLTLVEGVYSTHPYFEKYYDLSAFLDISPEYQKERILKRNPPFLAKRFFEEWIPLENVYFEKTYTKERADLILKI